MIVPIVMVMGGTFAFSAWSGSANAFFGQTAATVGYTESLSFVATNASMTPLTITGNAQARTTGINIDTPFYQVDSVSGGAASVVSVYTNVTNMVPGDWIEFQVMVTNTGSATLNTSTMSVTGANSYSELGQYLGGSGSSFSASVLLLPPVTTAVLDSSVNTGASNGYTGLFYLIGASTSTSIPAYLAPGGTFTYDVYAVFPSIAPSTDAGSSFFIGLSLDISVAQ